MRYPGKFNLFQRMMLRWRELHPYNAVHALPIAGTLDATRLRTAIGDVIARLGIGNLRLDGAQRRYAYLGGGTDVALHVGTVTDEADSVLAAEMERQINLPFELEGEAEPLRFFALTHERANEFWLGIAYDHFIAGGDSLTLLLADIVRAYAGGALPATALDVYPPTYGQLVRTLPGAFLRSLAHMPELVRDSKRAFRPRYRDVDDAYNEFALLRLPPADAVALRALATRFGVTLHDLVVAILLHTLSAFARGRRDDARRPAIAIASIVNLRRTFGGSVQSAFGQFLASLRIMHEVPDGISVAELAHAVNADSARIKRERLHLRTLFALTAAAVAWRHMSKPQRQRFYVKHYPAWAGVTMLDIGKLWPADLNSGVARYTRAVSTGPLTPAVLAISASTGALSMGVSYRRAAYDGTLVTALKDGFASALTSATVPCSTC